GPLGNLQSPQPRESWSPAKHERPQRAVRHHRLDARRRRRQPGDRARRTARDAVGFESDLLTPRLQTSDFRLPPGRAARPDLADISGGHFLTTGHGRFTTRLTCKLCPTRAGFFLKGGWHGMETVWARPRTRVPGDRGRLFPRGSAEDHG